MKEVKVVFAYFVLVFVLGANNAKAQWEKTKFPKTLVDTYTLFAKGDTMLAGTERGIYFSGNKGESWKQHKAMRHIDNQVSSFEFNQDYLFVGDRFGMHRFSFPLENNHRETINSGLEGDSRRINALFLYGGYIYAGTYDGLYRSNDNGDSWEAVGNVFNSSAKIVTSIIVADNALFVGTLDGIFRSNDNGENWIAVNKETDQEGEKAGSVADVISLVFQDGYLFAASGPLEFDPSSGGHSPSDGVYRSNNYGETWTRINDKFDPNSTRYDVKVLFLAANGSTIYTGTEYGLFISSDYGETWKSGIEKVNDKSKYFQALVAFDDYLFAGTEGGLYGTSNHGDNWDEKGVLRFLMVNELTVKDNNLFAATDDGIYKSDDNGTNWINSYERSGEDSTHVLSLVVFGNDIFAGTKDGIIRSSDDGLNWTKVFDGISISTGTKHIHTLTEWGDILFAGTKYGIYRSNNGNTWEDANDGFGQYPKEVTVIRGFDEYLFAGTSSGVYRSIDGGDTWEMAGKLSQVGIIPINDFIKKGSYLFAATTTAGIFASSNNGASWMGSDSGIPRSGPGNNSWVYAFAEQGEHLFTGTYVGAYSSANTGLNWQGINEGLEDEIDSDFRSLVIHEGYLFGGMKEIGVIKRSVSEIITSNEWVTTEEPSVFSLRQNYPNPFNPSTTIEFNLSDKAFVTLKVYDITGKEVATILARDMTPGNYAANWNAEQFASGVYFYRLDAGSFSQTKKLTLIK